MTAFRPRALSSKEVSILHQTPTIYFFFLIKKRFLLFSLFFLAFAIIIFPCFVPFSKAFSCFSGSRVMFFCLQVNARKKETKLKILFWFGFSQLISTIHHTAIIYLPNHYCFGTLYIFQDTYVEDMQSKEGCLPRAVRFFQSVFWFFVILIRRKFLKL